MATVTCTKKCYFYINDERVSTSTEKEPGLTPGLNYTPSKHMPDYDDSVYTDYEIRYDGTDYTTGSFPCPSSNFTVKYYFYGYEEASWKIGSTPEYSNISSTIEKYLSFGIAGYVARFKLTFANSGTVTFYTEGNSDTYGYLSEVSTLDSSTGGPTEALIGVDDAEDSNFNFQYNVTAGRTYYLWVRLYKIDATGTTTVYIKPSAAWQIGATPEYLNLSSSISYNYSFGKAGYVARMKVSFANSGTATFSTSGDSDTYGYLSTVSTLDSSTGAPTSIRASDDDSGTGRNCSFSYEVTAGTTYYFWVRLIDIDTTGTTTAHVNPPAKVKPWDWDASNGKASAAVTKAAHTAITKRGATTDFSYLVWNDLVDKVVEALTADGDSWNTNNSKYLSSSSTKMSPSDKVLTAKRFNALRWNIGRKYSTDITDRSRGQQVLGSYFTTLTDALNSWIATIT